MEHPARHGYLAGYVSGKTLTSAYAEVAGIDLPPGQYLALGTTTLKDCSATTDTVARCGIRLGAGRASTSRGRRASAIKLATLHR